MTKAEHTAKIKGILADIRGLLAISYIHHSSGVTLNLNTKSEISRLREEKRMLQSMTPEQVESAT